MLSSNVCATDCTYCLRPLVKKTINQVLKNNHSYQLSPVIIRFYNLFYLKVFHEQ